MPAVAVLTSVGATTTETYSTMTVERVAFTACKFKITNSSNAPGTFRVCMNTSMTQLPTYAGVAMWKFKNSGAQSIRLSIRK